MLDTIKRPEKFAVCITYTHKRTFCNFNLPQHHMSDTVLLRTALAKVQEVNKKLIHPGKNLRELKHLYQDMIMAGNSLQLYLSMPDGNTRNKVKAAGALERLLRQTRTVQKTIEMNNFLKLISDHHPQYIPPPASVAEEPEAPNVELKLEEEV